MEVSALRSLDAGRRPPPQPGARRPPRGLARLSVAGLALAASAAGALWLSPATGLTLASAILLGGVAVEFRRHALASRLEVGSDVALLAAVAGAAVSLLVDAPTAHPMGPPAPAVALATLAVLLTSAWGLLALRSPTRAHVAMLAAASTVSAADLLLVAHGAMATASDAAEVLSSAGVLGFAAAFALHRDGPAHATPTWWVSPALLGACAVGAGVLLLVGRSEPGTWLAGAGGTVLLLAVLALVAVRNLLTQQRTASATSRLAAALREREAAIASLTEAGQAVADSEARLRLLLDAAVDGVVELDSAGTVVRANRAFCAMVRLPAGRVVGRSWVEMTREVDASGALGSLLEGGEADLAIDGATRHLEARASTLPTMPPGTLLLVRDATEGRTAERTILSLVRSLEERDEQRTRLLQQTTAAIESERNRIALDIHDGPIQGVTAATLSLEAARLMLEGGDPEGTARLLREIQDELWDETENLRRVMSDLRPALLEERGLVAAVEATCERFEREHGIAARVAVERRAPVPEDVETLAFRLIQEALANVAKHSGARTARVRIDAGPARLEVEVADDGRGFDAGLVEEFLRAGRVGLASMRERAALGGGTLDIESRPGGGTRVLATLPFEAPSARRPGSQSA